MSVKEEGDRKGVLYMIIVFVIIIIICCIEIGVKSDMAYKDGYDEGYNQALIDYGIAE